MFLVFENGKSPPLAQDSARGGDGRTHDGGAPRSNCQGFLGLVQVQQPGVQFKVLNAALKVHPCHLPVTKREVVRVSASTLARTEVASAATVVTSLLAHSFCSTGSQTGCLSVASRVPQIPQSFLSSSKLFPSLSIILQSPSHPFMHTYVPNPHYRIYMIVVRPIITFLRIRSCGGEGGGFIIRTKGFSRSQSRNSSDTGNTSVCYELSQLYQ